MGGNVSMAGVIEKKQALAENAILHLLSTTAVTPRGGEVFGNLIYFNGVEWTQVIHEEASICMQGDIFLMLKYNDLMCDFVYLILIELNISSMLYRS